MSNEKQDLINHRLTATACKNYTDREIKKAKDELKTFFSKNTVNTEDHTNELAYQITAPSGAKLLQLQAIGGNSVKYEPSVASDDTTALIKTMPSVVYDFDINKVKGVSEVSENLIVLNDAAETTKNGITYKIENGVITLNGTATSQTDMTFGLNITLSAGSYYLMIFNWQTNLGIDYFIVNQDYNYDFYNLSDGSSVIKTMTFNGNEKLRTLFIRITNGTTISGTLQFKPMLIKGSTAPTEFKVGYEGIHNNELTGFKVEGANLFDKNSTPIQTYIDGLIDKLTPNLVANTFEIAIKPNTTYTVYCFEKDESRLRIGTSTTAITEGYLNNVIRATVNDTITFKSNFNDHYLYVNIKDGSDISSIVNGLYISIGSYAPTSYVPYISPTTIPIDLTTIKDSNNVSLFPSGKMMGNSSVADFITPYNQESRWDEIVFNGSENWSKSTTTNCDRYTLAITINNTTNALCNHFTYSRNADDYTIGLLINNVGSQIIINFATYGTTTLEQFKQWLVSNPITLQFERATPLISNTDLSQLKSIQGHSNGSITALNTYDMSVPSEIRYNSIIQETLVDSVTIEGANLIGLNDETTSDYKISNGELTVFSTASLEAELKNTITLIANQAYSFSRFIAAPLNTSLFDENGNMIIKIGWWESNKTYTPTSNVVIKYITWNADSKAVGITFKPMLVKGNTIPTTFKPYKETITRNLPTIESDGYGVNANAHNLRVFSDYEGNEVNKRYTNVNKNILGDNTWTYDNDYNRFYATIQDFPAVAQITVDLLANNYTAKTNSEGIDANWDMVIYNSNLINNVYIHDHRYNDATIFKTAKSGEPMYYPLADTSKTETDLDSFDYFFDVEEGDTITFNNPYAQQVYATYSFIIKEVKSNE